MIKIYDELVQGSEEWLKARCGILTASEMKLAITPTLKVADNDKTRAHVYDLAAQTINEYVEPHYINDDMLRGQDDEVYAREEYRNKYAEVYEVGFIVNDNLGFALGFSPDGLVGDDGFIEIKSRRQKYQLQTIVENKVPEEYMLQIQTGLLVSGRKWCDFISYCSGMPMFTLRVHKDEKMQEAIILGAIAFYEKLDAVILKYADALADETMRLIPTVRRIIEEITI
jgi:putative phage-type endonuclease